MEFPWVLNVEIKNVEIQEVNKKEMEFPEVTNQFNQCISRKDSNCTTYKYICI